MFMNCHALSCLDITGWNLDLVLYKDRMFKNLRFFRGSFGFAFVFGIGVYFLWILSNFIFVFEMNTNNWILFMICVMTYCIKMGIILFWSEKRGFYE